MDAKPGLIVMASGFSARFGANKLALDVCGKTMIERCLAAIPVGFRTVVVTRYDFVKEISRGMGFNCADNQLPYLRDTIRIGLDYLGDCPSACFLVGDQPWLTRETLSKMRLVSVENPGRIVRAASASRPGNPVIFPKELFSELKNLAPNESGTTVIRRHGELVTFVEVDERELRDVDRQSDL